MRTEIFPAGLIAGRRAAEMASAVGRRRIFSYDYAAPPRTHRQKKFHGPYAHEASFYFIINLPAATFSREG